MSNERIDHAAEARKSLEWLDRGVPESVMREDGPLVVATAQVHAILALVEQQRLANLLALAESGRTTVNGARAALAGLYDGSAENGSAFMALRPDIAAALGLDTPND